jgi:hypothetical protein
VKRPSWSLAATTEPFPPPKSMTVGRPARQAAPGAVAADDALARRPLGCPLSVVGPPGPRGNSVLYGPSNPTTQGINGDFYINISTYRMFGPKASGAWPGAGVALIGPQGSPGPQLLVVPRLGPVPSSTAICSGLPVSRGPAILSLAWAPNHARPFTAGRFGQRQSGRRKHAGKPTGSPRRGVEQAHARLSGTGAAIADAR